MVNGRSVSTRTHLSTAIALIEQAGLPAMAAQAEPLNDDSLLTDAATYGVTPQWICGEFQRDGICADALISVWEVVYERTGWIDSLAGEVAPAAIRQSCPQFAPALNDLTRENDR
ncbi:hypothetical protein FIV07_25825 [Mycobacterium sp. THAF192]|nr:hypothetical protein FIV07_25825 [Mycobacterium sp. THAF192]